ncbi:MAG: hypothetical protein WC538_21020 [Thermoanaerobaculia bacterium]|jgi:hypothetical protein
MQALTVKIAVRDQNGRVVSEKEVATYAGLLSRAHDEGLKSIGTMLTQMPTKDNGQVAIAAATVITSKGTFMGIGDASPANVNRKIVPHIIRMAETRAKARALRDAVNIGMVCLEELGGAEGDADVALDDREERERDNVRELPRRDERPSERRDREPDRPRDDRREEPRRDDRRDRDDRPRDDRRGQDDRRGGSGNLDGMTDAQKRLLYRIVAQEGIEGQDATDYIVKAANVNSLSEITKKMASSLIDRWKDAA